METKKISAEKRARWSWYFYDFGNSAYASVILLAVYSVYFKDKVVGGAQGTWLWGLSVGIAAILVAIVSPVLGTIADFTKHKKRFLIIFTALAVTFTALLFFVGEGDVFLGMFFFILAEIGYRAAQVFYDALLPDVSTPETIGVVSGRGWAVGMGGGILALLVAIIPVLAGSHMIPYTFIITAVFYLLSSIPAFLWINEAKSEEILPEGETQISFAFKRLIKTFRSIRNFKEFFKYMAAFLLYNDGIMMLMDFAAIIGGTLFGLTEVQLILLVVVLQVAGAGGALLFGRMADKKGSKIATLISLVILVVSIGGLFFIQSIAAFFVIGALAGFSLSAAQAVSRSIVVQLVPAENITEFYGFLSVAGRTSTFIGPLVFSILTSKVIYNWYLNSGLTEQMAEHNSLLWGIGSIIFFLVVGGVLLLTVNIKKAKASQDQ